MFRVSLEDENPAKDLAKAIYLHKILLNKKQNAYCTAKTLRKKIIDIRNELIFFNNLTRQQKVYI